MMIFRAPILVLISLLALTGPLAAAEPQPAVEGPVNVEMPPVMAPMSVAGRLQGYAYFTVSLLPGDRNKLLVVREKMPFLQDAFLRELNGASIVKESDPAAVDKDALKARLMVRLAQVLPAGTVNDLEFLKIELVPLTPR